VLIWLFRHEAAGGHADAVERRAAVVIGVVLGVLAVYLIASATHALATHAGHERAVVGIVTTAASMVVLPVLARAKLRLAAQLGSPGLRSDGVLSLAGSALAAATLVSIVLDSALGWWWADAVAALLIAALLLVESQRAVRAGHGMGSSEA